jgi:hypothetical protein
MEERKKVPKLKLKSPLARMRHYETSWVIHSFPLPMDGTADSVCLLKYTMTIVNEPMLAHDHSKLLKHSSGILSKDEWATNLRFGRKVYNNL